VAGKKNEPPSSSRSYPRDRPVEHLASHPRHHHVANDEIEGALPDLEHALDAALDRGYLKGTGDQVIAENLPEITAIFQEQNPLGRPGHGVRGSLNLESGDLRRIGIENWTLLTHSRKLMSRTGALRRPPTIRIPGEILNQPALRRKLLTMHESFRTIF